MHIGLDTTVGWLDFARIEQVHGQTLREFTKCTSVLS